MEKKFNEKIDNLSGKIDILNNRIADLSRRITETEDDYKRNELTNERNKLEVQLKGLEDQYYSFVKLVLDIAYDKNGLNKAVNIEDVIRNLKKIIPLTKNSRLTEIAIEVSEELAKRGINEITMPIEENPIQNER